MIVTNKKTGKDITGLVIKRMEGKITKNEFEKLAELECLMGPECGCEDCKKEAAVWQGGKR